MGGMSEPASTTLTTSVHSAGVKTGSSGLVSRLPTESTLILMMSSSAAAILNPNLLQPSAISTQIYAPTSMIGAAGLIEVATPYATVMVPSTKITSEKPLVSRA